MRAVDPISADCRPTLNELKRRWETCLAQSDIAVCNHPRAYSEIRHVVRHVLNHPIDIDDYFAIAVRLTRLIETMGERTLFYLYFYDQLNPMRRGRAHYFRPVCRDLLCQIDTFAKWRARRRALRLVR